MGIAQQKRGVPKKILLVEDNQLLRELGRDSLRSFGFDVTLATNGFEATDLNEENIYDLIMLDIKMPGIDGFETIRRLKTKTNCPTVIALTSYSDSDHQESFKEAGFQFVLTKPYTIKQCYQSISKALKL